jgi:chorismate lyase/3-hydroxybenzoate synthase
MTNPDSSVKNKKHSPYIIQYQHDIDIMTDEQAGEPLAMIGFAEDAEVLSEEMLCFQVGIPSLDGQQHWEVWLSQKSVEYGHWQHIQYSQNDDVLFGHVLLNEQDYSNVQDASEVAYRQLFELLKQKDYPYLFRIWNYFPAINEEQDELERYRLFCLGRQTALDIHGNFEYSPPAATAIGTANAGLQIYFLAAKAPGMQLENPRQVSAFLYPKEYGPVSPAFSRATVKEWAVGDKLEKHIFVSGTASIVGHETRHHGDVLKQLKETLTNIDALVAHGDDTLSLPVRQVGQLSMLKVYLRYLDDLEKVKAFLADYFQASQPDTLFLQGDVCRADLLIEIEAHYA